MTYIVQNPVGRKNLADAEKDMVHACNCPLMQAIYISNFHSKIANNNDETAYTEKCIIIALYAFISNRENFQLYNLLQKLQT